MIVVPKLRDNSMSPNYHHRHYTPPRSSAKQSDSPMLTPSSLRHTTSLYDPLQSPCKSTAQAQASNPFFTNMPQPIPADDEEGSIFLSSAASDSFTSFLSSQPLRTPVKQAHRTHSRSILSPVNIFSQSPPSPDPKASTRIGKRKSTLHATPRRQHNLTPLKLFTPKDSSVSSSFDRLAPLAAPKFTTRTPQTKAETDAYLKRQTATMTKLKISDNNNIVSDDEFQGILNDSGCEMDEDSGNALFTSKQQLSDMNSPTSKSKNKEEVAEAISPGGHIVKRRARSRPVSAELLELYKSPKSPINVGLLPVRKLKCVLISFVQSPQSP
jgi:mitosis inhibitor protein kinase SWE1